MDCSKLSANIAAATCRTGRIDVRELMLVNWDDWQKFQRGFDSSWAGRLVADTRAGIGTYRTAGVPALVGDTFTFYAIRPEGTTTATYRLSLLRKTRSSTSGYEVIFDAQAQAWDTPATYTVRANYESEDGMYYVAVDRAGLTAVLELEGQSVPPLFKVTRGARVEGGRIVMDQPKPEDMTLTNIGDVSEPIYVQPGDRVRFRYLTPCSITPGFIIAWRYAGSGWSGTSKPCYEQYDEWLEFPGVPAEGVVYFCKVADGAGSTVPAEYEVIRAHPSAGNDLTLSPSDGITYPPVVSLLATHERGIVSFAEEVKGAYLNGYAHRIQFTAFDRKQSVKDVLNILGRGRFVALARYEQDGEDVVVVYGADCGMVAEAETFDSSNTDGEIGQAVLATDEGCMESVPMLTLEPSGSLATVADAWAWLKEHSFG